MGRAFREYGYGQRTAVDLARPIQTRPLINRRSPTTSQCGERSGLRFVGFQARE